MNISAEVSCRGRSRPDYSCMSIAQHSKLSAENGYHSELYHFSTDAFLKLLTNNCKEIFAVQH